MPQSSHESDHQRGSADRSGPTRRPQRPQEHTTPLPDSEASDLLRIVVDDDDAVIMPAPSPQILAPLPVPHQSRLDNRRLFYRQTMIPILLTCGCLLAVLGLLWFVTDAESVIRRSGLWLPLTFVAIGVALLLMAVLNMAQVKHLLAKRPKTEVR
jgi:hypothetical protein